MGNTRRPSLAAALVAAARLVHQGQAILGSVWRIIKSCNYIRNVPQAQRLAGAKDRWPVSGTEHGRLTETTSKRGKKDRKQME